MLRKPIAVVVAMRRELAPLLRGRQPSKADGVEIFDLGSAVVAVGGIGRAAARRAAEVLTARFAPEVMVSAGIAGALSPALKVGEVVQARAVVDADSGERFAASGDAVTITTVSSVSGPAEKRMLAERWNADVVDMEASAVAAVARKCGIEFAAIKAISDELDFEMPPVGQFVDGSGTFETLRFAAFVAVRPKWWGAVRQLNLNSRIATVNLCAALQHLIQYQSQTPLEEKIVGS